MFPQSILACPHCSSQLLHFERFESELGKYAAILIVLICLSTPVLIKRLGWKFKRIREKKKWYRRAIPHLFFLVVWVTLLARNGEFRPDYNRADNIILFSDVLAYSIFFPFMLVWNFIVNPVLFSAPEIIAGVVVILWMATPPFIYGRLANKFDYQLKK